MVSLDNLLEAIDERTIARKIGIPHDEARMRYPLRSNTVGSFEEFSDIIGDYYNHHFTTCVTSGGRMSLTEATGRAKEIITREYRRRNGDLVTAFNDAHDGTNGGLRAILDLIAEALKIEAVERHIREMFDRHVAPNSWEQKVAIIRQLLGRLEPHRLSSIRADQPERYARDYTDLIRAYVTELQRTSSVFRRM